KEMVYQYPLPENIGVELELDRNNVAKRVLPNSPSERAGMKAGDVIAQANDTPVLTSADLQYALDPLPDPGRVNLLVERKGKRLPPKALALAPGWRKTDVSWRPSVWVVQPTLGIAAERLSEDRRKALGMPPGRLAIRVADVYSWWKGM